MWQHEIIESISKNIHEGSQEWQEEKRAIISAIKKSHTFYFGNSSQYETMIKSVSGKKLTVQNLPYDITLVEYICDAPVQTLDGIKSEKSCVASLCVKNNILMANEFFIINIGHKWMLQPYATQYKDDGTMQCVTLAEAYDKFNITHEQMFKSSCGMASIVQEMIKILNAKNIVFKTKTPPEKLNRARIKRKTEPLVEYKILEVVKGVPKKKDFGSVPWDYTSKSDMAFHLCRGHFKTYTNDAPLFGKYTGTFWWQPQARGSKENGEIVKDYVIKQA